MLQKLQPLAMREAAAHSLVALSAIALQAAIAECRIMRTHPECHCKKTLKMELFAQAS